MAAAKKTPAAADAATVPSNPSMGVGDSSVKAAAVRRRAAAAAAAAVTLPAADNADVARDASHSIRADPSLEKPGDLSQSKMHFDSTIAYRRRKGVPKPERPRWKTLLSIGAKNVVLILVLSFVGRLVWKSVGKGELGSIVDIGVLDFERRTVEMEDFWKRTASMLQVQIDAVDKKVENKVGSLKGELAKKLDEKSHYFEGELKKLHAKADGLDKSLMEYRDFGFLSREELDKFFREMREAKGLGKDGREISLDEIKAYAREIVGKEIERHAADGLGLVDYALGSGGGQVVAHSEPFAWKRRSWLSNLRAAELVHESANKVIEPSLGEPGQCFALKGNEGFIEIRLRTAIIPEAVTLEHVAKSVAYDRTSAPKSCRVTGWYQGFQEGSAAEKSVLAEFTYDLNKSSAQTFNVKSPDEDHPINMVRLDFMSNHGSLSHTCIYRLRVHGHELQSS